MKKMRCPNIDRFEVINLGVHGYDTRYTAERYRKRGVKYKPDLVVWLFVDMLRIDEELIPLSEKYDKTLKKGKDYYLPWRTAKNEIQDKLGTKGMIDYQKKALNIFSSYYQGPLLIAPSWRIEKNSLEEEALKNYSKKTAGFYMDSLQKFPGNEMVFDKDPHPNKKGHQYIADKIMDYLLKGKIVPCMDVN